MYHMNDKSGAVREVQKYLLSISQTEEYLPHITVDGFYNEDTRLAVESFQRNNGLKETGATDRETFDLLYSEYIRVSKIDELEKNTLNSDNFPLRRGSSGTDVAILNSHIRELSKYYTDLGNPIGDYFSSETEESIILLQKYFKEDINGIVDAGIYTRINEEVKMRKNFS